MTNPEKPAAPRRRRGGQPGNRNAVKTGAETAQMRAMRKRIWDWRKQSRRVLALARCELQLRAALAQMDRDKANLGIVMVRAAGELTSAA